MIDAVNARRRLICVAIALGLTLGACSINSTPSPSASASPDPTVAPTPDTAVPTVASQDPAPDGTIGSLGKLIVTFSEPVIGIDAARLQVRDASGSVLPASISGDEGGRRFSVTPVGPLTVAAHYTVTLAGAIHDAAGNQLVPTSWGVVAANAIAFGSGTYTGYQFEGGIRHLTGLQRLTLSSAASATASEYRSLGGQGFLHVTSGGLSDYWVHGTPDGRMQDDLTAPITPLPACDYVDLPAARTDLADWMTTVLDTVFQLPSSYRPADLVDASTAGLNSGYRIRRIVVADLQAMVDAAAADGVRLAVLSSFRSYAQQIDTFQYWVNLSGYKAALLASARPGHSEHQLGTTIDFRSVNGPSPFGVADWATTTAGAWMRDNAWRFGWVMSYPKGTQAVSCYEYEPWHYRYFGRDAASAIHASGLTAREWLWNQGFGIH
jgi:D-alanyl-D-alanine carboxypeptidase